MKKLWYGVIAFAFIVIGCVTTMTVDVLFERSKLVGVAAAAVANSFETDVACRNAVVEIVNSVEYVVPQTNETFEAAWMPIARRHVDSLVSGKVIDKGQAGIVLCVFNAAVKGADYLVEVRYPQAKDKKEFAEAAVHGFCEGFLVGYKPANAMSSSASLEYDRDAYDYLKAAVRD